MQSKEHYDTIIVGAGLWGMSIAYELSKSGTKSGEKVLVLDKSEVGQGMSKGAARMSKVDPRSKEGKPLVIKSQDIIISEFGEDSGILTRFSCFDVCDSPETEKKFKEAYDGSIDDMPTPDTKGEFGVTTNNSANLYAYSKEKTYVLNPEKLLNCLVKGCADSNNCDIKTGKEVIAWETAKDRGVVVKTKDEQEYKAKNMIIAAQGWSMDLLNKGNVAVHENIFKNIYNQRAPIWQFDFPKGVTHAIGRSSIMQDDRLYLDIYYLPEFSTEHNRWVMKVGMNSMEDRNNHLDSPAKVNRVVSPEETREVRRLFQEKLGITLGEPLTSEVCYMTNTKPHDGKKNHMVGQIPDTNKDPIPNLVLVTGENGLGAKICGGLAKEVVRGMRLRWQGVEIFDNLSPMRFTGVVEQQRAKL